MKLFNRNHKTVKEDITIEGTQIFNNGLDEYIKYYQKIMSFMSSNTITEKTTQLKEEYINSIITIINYLRNTLTNEQLDSCTHTIDINLRALLSKCPNTISSLIKEQDYAETIYITDNKHLPHFHTLNGYVDMAENIEALPGLNHILANQRINSCFNRLSIIEARALLNQMSLLPPDNNLDKEIASFNERNNLHKLLIRDIIESLLSTKNKYDLTRAMIFASCFDVPFDFTPYNHDNDKNKTLEFKKPNC